MDKPNIVPGPDASSAFRIGVIAAAVGALAVIGFLYWLGVLSVPLVGYALLIIFPVYLVGAATLLSVWLGYDVDETDLRPVYREKGGS